MYYAYKFGDHMPIAADINDDAKSDELRKMASLINRLTSFHPKDRPSPQEVLKYLLMESPYKVIYVIQHS